MVEATGLAEGTRARLAEGIRGMSPLDACGRLVARGTERELILVISFKGALARRQCGIVATMVRYQRVGYTRPEAAARGQSRGSHCRRWRCAEALRERRRRLLVAAPDAHGVAHVRPCAQHRLSSIDAL